MVGSTIGHACSDFSNEFKIFGSVDGPAHTPEIPVSVNLENLKTLRMLVQIWHNVLALVGCSRLLPGDLQGFLRTYFNVKADRIGPLPRETVGCKIDRLLRLDKRLDRLVDQGWIDKWAVCRDPNDRAGAVCSCRLVVSVQNILRVAAEDLVAR